MEHHHLSGANELSELAQGYEKIILEIGFGNGENTAFLAAKNPKALVVASEVYLSGIGSLLNSIAQNSLNNIKTETSLSKTINAIKSNANVNALWKWFVIFALVFLLLEILILKYLK